MTDADTPAPPRAARTTLRSLLRTGAGIAVAMGVMNLSTYLFTILAARVLGPAEYGAFGSLMGLLMVVNVLSLGLQATGARRVAAAPPRRDAIEGEVLAATYRSATALTVLCLVLVPAVSWVLDLGGWTAALALAAAAFPTTLMGGYAGVLQGEQRWVPLALVYLGMGLGRLAVGAVGLLLVPSAAGAMSGVAVGAAVPAVIGALALRRPGHRASRAAHARGRAGAVLREVAANSHALLAFFALTNTDVVAARIVFDERDAGLYAAGLILTKAVLFLPQFVVVIAFPSMSGDGERHRMYLRGLLVVGLIGLAATAGTALLSDLAVVFVGGAEYAEVRPLLWAFAALGTAYALVQLMVYEVVARQHAASVYVVWAGLLAVATGAAVLAGVGTLVATAAVVSALVLVALVATALARGVRTAG